jgi:hypothetical protein
MEVKDTVSAYLFDLILKMKCLVMNSAIATRVFDRSLSFLHGKKTTFIVDTQGKYIDLTIYQRDFHQR